MEGPPSDPKGTGKPAYTYIRACAIAISTVLIFARHRINRGVTGSVHLRWRSQEKGRRDDSVVLPMQLKMLFTKEKYKVRSKSRYDLHCSQYYLH